jgi:hypothetical protein
LSVVDTDGTAADVLAVQSLKSGGSLILGAEVDVSETLEGTGVAVGGKRDTGDVTVLLEDLLDALVGALERDVAEEESVAGRAALVTVLVGTGTVGIGLSTGSAEVDVELTTVKLVLVHLLLGLGGIGSVGELDVTESLSTASLTVSDDTAANNLTEALELAAEPVLIDVPAHVTNEEVLDTLLSGGLLGLGLLDSGGSGLLSLALLGGSLVALGSRRVVGVGIRVVRVGGSGGLSKLVYVV